MDKFTTKVRSLVREYVPGDQLQRYDAVTKETDRTGETFGKLLAAPNSNGTLAKVYPAAFQYAMSCFDENRVARQMLATIADALTIKEDDLVVLRKAIAFEPLRTPSTQSSAGQSLVTSSVATPKERHWILEAARERNKQRAKINQRMQPIRIIRLRALTFLKGVDSRELALFPHHAPKVMAPLTRGGPTHSSDTERCKLFAKDQQEQVERTMNMNAFERGQIKARKERAVKLAKRTTVAKQREAKRRKAQTAKHAKRLGRG